MQEYEEKELANLIYKYKTEIMIPKTLYEKLRPEIKELINKVFFESWTRYITIWYYFFSKTGFKWN